MRPPLACTTALLLYTAGCAAPVPNVTSQYGNYVNNAPSTHETQLAADAARQMQLMYPPAKTRLTLMHATSDRFGQQLVELLRTQGYAVQQPATNTKTAASTIPAPAIIPSADVTGIPFSYVLDTVTPPGLYRVTLMFGSQSLTRAYSPQSETVKAAGAWVRKE